jgi:hypothetical protein
MIWMYALAALQAGTALKQADEIRQGAELTNALNEVNAKYVEQDAYEAQKFGDTQVANYEKQIDQTVGAQKAGYASAGVDVGFGTAAEVQNETKLNGVLNILDIQNQARAKARGLTLQARNIRQGMSVGRSQSEINASATETSGILNAGATGYRAYTQESGNDTGLKNEALGGSNRTGK